ncbi:MAG TPA: hypothetical protein VHW42_12245 [Actinomycetes bacterium]|nr:hypothetical protein [Actinomycetes bacterium]
MLPGRPGPVRGRDPVSWVGPDPAPNWLDVAREYSERWTHQQQIRDAAEIPGRDGPAPAAQVTLDVVDVVDVIG